MTTKYAWKSGIRIVNSGPVPHIFLTTCEECDTETSSINEETNISFMCSRIRRILDSNGKKCDTCINEYYRRKLSPWDMDETEEEKACVIWQAFQPNDFLFALSHQSYKNETLVFIVPKRYYDIYHTSYHYSMPITNILPIDLIETSPSIFKMGCDEKETLEKLQSAGFIHSEKFQTHMHNELIGFLAMMGFSECIDSLEGC